MAESISTNTTAMDVVDDTVAVDENGPAHDTECINAEAADDMNTAEESDSTENKSTVEIAKNEPKLFYASHRKIYPFIKVFSNGCRYDLYKYRNAKERLNIDRYVNIKHLHRIFGAHTSEHQWNLPKSHPRHLLQFPIEILTRILSFALVSPYEVTPIAVPCNWGREKLEPSHSIGLLGSNLEGTTFRDYFRTPGLDTRPKDGSKGPQPYSGYCRNRIDATVLRSCKLLYQEGLPLLYGENEFIFNLNDKDFLYNPRRDHQSYEEYETKGKVVVRDRTMPRAEEFASDTIQNAIRNMGELSASDLPDWQWCDPFIRWLHSIGPKHRSFLRKLRLVGPLLPRLNHAFVTLTHRQGYHLGNIAYFIKAYAPFIIRYCPNLEKFGIGIERFYLTPDGSIPEEELINYIGDPEDQDIQPGDEKISAELGEEMLKTIRTSREGKRLKKKAKLLLQIQNDMAHQLLKPLVDEITPQMKNLRTIEVKRYELPDWTDFPKDYQHEPDSPSDYEPPSSEHGVRSSEDDHLWPWSRKYGPSKNHPISWYPFIDKWGRTSHTYIDMELADEAKKALEIAVFQRSKEKEAAKNLDASSMEDMERQASNLFISQLDLPDVSPMSQSGRGFRGRGHGRGRGDSSTHRNWRAGFSSQGLHDTGEGDGARRGDGNNGGSSHRGRGGRGPGGRSGRGVRGGGRGRKGN